MSIDNICKELATLPYADMKLLGEKLGREFEEVTGNDSSMYLGTRMAEALVSLAKQDIPQSDISNQEDKLLRRIFSRQRSMLIKLNGKGWNVSIGTLHSNVLGTSLREAIRSCLDQLVVAEALNGDMRK